MSLQLMYCTVLYLMLQFIRDQRAFKDAFSVETPMMRSFGPGYNFDAVDDKWMGAWLTDLAK